MTLQEQLDALRERELERTPPPVLEIAQKALRMITETGTASGAIGVGDTAPEFALPDLEGQTVSLRELRRRGPVILDFFRGGWCPFCSLELRAYQQLIEDIEEAGASLVAISPETPRFLRETAREQDLQFPVLSDHDNRTARAYGIVYTVPSALRSVYEGFGLDLPARHDSDSFELPVPATYLVDTEGIVRRAFVDVDTSHRGEPADFLAGVRELRERD